MCDVPWADVEDGGVDLRTKSSMLASKAIVPGKPEASPMIQRILSRACPPDKNISMAGIERMGDRELQTLRIGLRRRAGSGAGIEAATGGSGSPRALGVSTAQTRGNTAGEGGRSRG